MPAGPVEDDDLEALEAVIRKFSGSDDPTELADALEAMSDRAALLVRLGRNEEALAQHDDALRLLVGTRVGEDPDIDPEMSIAWVKWNRAYLLQRLKRFRRAMAQCDELLDKYFPGESKELPEITAETLLVRGKSLLSLDRTEDAIADFDVLIAATAPTISASSVAAEAFVQKSFALAERKDYEGAIATADSAVQRFGSSEDVDIRFCVAYCLSHKSWALWKLGRKDAATFAAEELVNHFGADLDPRIEKLVARHAHRLGRSRSRLKFLDLG